MGRITFVTNNDVVVEKMDRCFDVVTVTPNSSRVGKGNYELLILDSRSERDIRATIRNIYKRDMVNTGT